MRVPILLLTAIIVGAATAAAPAIATGSTPRSTEATQPVDVSAAKRKRPRVYRARPQTQIACTRYGCRPIPPGCRIETEYNPFSWNPSGFDAVVCPGR